MVHFRNTVALASIVGLMAFASAACNGGGGGNQGGGGDGGPTTTLIGGGGGTTTTLTGATTTSTVLGASTTTLPTSDGFSCATTISLSSNETLGSLQFDVDYSGIGAQPGGFEGAADMVNCSADAGIAGAITTFNDDEAARTLRTGIISLTGFTGPTDLQTCNYVKDSGAEPVASDFVITVVDAADPAFTPRNPTLTLSTSCVPGGGGGGPTTTVITPGTTTTTTTMGGGGGPGTFAISFDVDDALNFGALQFDVDYSAAPGAFDGAADAVDCTAGAAIAGAIVTFNNDVGTSNLRTGIISLAGFAGPATLATCTFNGTGGTPVPGDFTITIIDASDPGLAPIVPQPTISVSNIAAS